MKQYVHPLHSPLPPSLNHMVLYIAYCYTQGLAASTTRTHISALSFTFQLGGFEDITQHFLIKKQLQGFTKLNPSSDSRLPITPSILTKLIAVLPHISNSAFITSMLRAMFLLAFYACLRVGEMTNTGSMKQHFILVKHLKIVSEDKQDENLQLTIPHSKHSHKSVTLQIPKNQNLRLCPYVACKEFLSLRYHKSPEEPLFSFMDGAPVSRKFFTEHLQRAISACGLPMQRYQAHSFRIGAATSAAESGASDIQIQSMGRWKSAAFKKYIRIPILNLQL